MSQMRGTTILWSQFIVAAIGAVIALQAATQYVAHKLGHQSQLGEAAYHILGYPMYWPWQYWQWLYHFDYYAKAIFFQGSLVIYGGMFCVFMALVFMSVNRARRNRSPDTYGSARWGHRKDLQQAGLLNDKGIVLAQTQDSKRQLLRHDGAEHCFVFAPTRSGKGVGIVIPTLLSWPGSVIVYDMKRENWDVTAGWRRQFSHVLRFEPTAEFSVRFNPLLEVRMGENEVRDVQNIADILVDPDGSKERMDHWEKTGHSLLVGVILHVLYAETDKSLRGVANFLSHPKRTINQTLDHMLAYPHP
ncbi:MAG: type IV secretory system conjugative DNA transfer family protein, partial [Thiolinea sp.]